MVIRRHSVSNWAVQSPAQRSLDQQRCRVCWWRDRSVKWLVAACPYRKLSPSGRRELGDLSGLAAVGRQTDRSDFHFDKERKWDSDPVLTGPADAVRRFVADGLPPDVVAITGDVANKGRPEDYQEASRWIEGQLLPALPEGFASSRIVFVPGNHDVDREFVKRSARAVQSDLLTQRSQDSIADILGDEEERAVLLKRHDAFVAFVNRARPAGKALDAPWWSEVIGSGNCAVSSVPGAG